MNDLFKSVLINIEQRKALCIFLFVLLITNHLTAQFSQIQEVEVTYENFDTEQGLPSSETYNMLEDEEGYFWFSTDRGIVRYDGVGMQFFGLNEGLSNLVNFNFISIDTGGFLLDDLNGQIHRWTDTAFVPFSHNELLKKKFPARRIALHAQTDSTLIFFSDMGFRSDTIYHLHMPSGRIVKEEYHPELNLIPNSLIHENLLHLLPEVYFQHNPWLNQANNIVKGLRNKQKPYLYCFLINPEQPREYWLGTSEGAYLFSLDEPNKVKHYLPEAEVSSIHYDNEGSLWFTSLNKGVFYVANTSIHNLRLSQKKEERFIGLHAFGDWLIAQSQGRQLYAYHKSGKIIQKPSEHRYGKFWFGRDENQLITSNYVIQQQEGELSFDKRKGYEERYQLQAYFILKGQRYYYYPGGLVVPLPNDEIEHLFKGRVYCSLVKDSLTIWLGTKDGLFAYDTQTKTTTQVQLLTNKIQSRINDIVKINEDEFWLATVGQGLFYYNKGEVKQMQSSKLLSVSINKLYLQNDSILWLATNTGLNRLLLAENGVIRDIQIFSRKEGLISSFVNDIVEWQGNIYLSTNRGVCYFDPNNLDLNFLAPPKLKLLYIKSNGSVIRHEKNRLIQLKHWQNDIQLSFVGITNFHPNGEIPFYRYRLIEEGEDEESMWNFQNESSLVFHNLPTGHYVIEIQCQSNNRIWSSSSRIELNIQPHYTQTPIFWLVIFLLFIGLIFIVIRWRTQIVQHRISMELKAQKAEMAVLVNQMNPHFVFNVLNSIEGFILKNDILNACEYIGKFALLMRNSLNYSREQFNSILEEVKFLEAYLELEKLRFDNKFSYRIDYEDELSDINVPSLMVQPLIENAIKHAFVGKDEGGYIHIQYKRMENNKIQVSVLDNGMWIENKRSTQSKQTTSLGLKIIQDRLQLMKNDLKDEKIEMRINTDINSGTEIILVLPIILAKET